MTTSGDTAKQSARRSRRTATTIAIVVSAVLVVGGGTTGLVLNAQKVESEQLAAAKAAAEEAERARLQELHETRVQAAGAFTDQVANALEQGSPSLASVADAAKVTVAAQELTGALDGSDAELVASFTAARLAFRVYNDQVLSNSANRIAKAKLASKATKADAGVQLLALERAIKSYRTDPDQYATTAAALLALEKSHGAAVKAKAAAAAAAARQSGGGGSGGSSGGGSSSGGGGGNSGGGAGGGGSAGGGGGGTSGYTDAQARADVVRAHGGVGLSANCYKINWGTWSAGNTPPPPARGSIAAGGWLGFEAHSTGTSGAVTYYACY